MLWTFHKRVYETSKLSDCLKFTDPTKKTMRRIFSAHFMIMTLTFQTVRVIFGTSTVAWLLYRYYLTTPLFRYYLLSDVITPAICNILLIFASCSLSVPLIRLIALGWQSSKNFVATNASHHRSQGIRQYLVVSLAIELLMAVATSLLFFDLIDIPKSLKQALVDEVKTGTSDRLLKYGHDTFGCCGIDFEYACRISYPPFAPGNISYCRQGSDYCRNNCLNVFIVQLISPLRWERQILGYAIVPLVVANAIILSVLFANGFTRHHQNVKGNKKSMELCIESPSAPLIAEQRESFAAVTITNEQVAHPVSASSNKNKTKPAFHGLKRKSSKLLQKLNQQPQSKFVIRVKDRRYILQESFEQLNALSPEQWRQEKFVITFDGETGVDNGGLLREWFVLVTRQLFSRKMALFTRQQSHTSGKYEIDPRSSQAFSLELYKFTGRLFAKAILHRVLIGRQLATSLFKQILGKPAISLADLQVDDEDFYQGLVALRQLTSDELRQLDLRFVYEPSPFVRFSLAPFDYNKIVDPENLQLYMELTAAMKLRGSIEPQLTAFLEGFHSIIPQNLLTELAFDEEELSALISGDGHISIRALKKMTRYVNGNDETEQIAWFWQALGELETKDRKRLLKFFSGVDALPVGGSRSYYLAIIIDENQPPERLPTARTCFNEIHMPKYPSYQVLCQKLKLAITEGCEGFGLH